MQPSAFRGQNGMSEAPVLRGARFPLVATKPGPGGRNPPTGLSRVPQAEPSTPLAGDRLETSHFLLGLLGTRTR
jgi:hypothetical protein